MASTRRRPPAGFDTSPSSVEETITVSEVEEKVVEEVIVEEPVLELPPVEEPPIAVIVAPVEPITTVVAQPVPPKPKKHPRNIPKFSRIK